MKKLSISVVVLFIIALVVGLNCKKTYSHIDFTNKEQLVENNVGVGFYSANDFDLTVDGEIGDEVVEMSEENGYLVEDGKFVDDEGNPIGHIMTEEGAQNEVQENVDKKTMESVGQDDIANKGKTNDVVTNEEAVQKEYDVTTNWTKYIDMDTEQAIRAVLDDAQYVVIATATGDAISLGGALQQEVKVKQVVKGEDEEGWKGKKLKVLNTSDQIHIVEGSIAILGKVNIMQEGKDYLIFLNNMNQKAKKYDNMAYLADEMDIPYFCLDDMETKVGEAENGRMYYKEVMDYEFFVSDEVALEKLLEVKEEYLEKYVGEDELGEE